MRVHPSVMALFVALASFGLSAPAYAWTEADVDGMSAEVELGDAGQIAVSVRLHLHIRGGWLEQLEVAGFDTGLVLEEGATFVGGGGQTFSPRVRQRDDGRILISFPRRQAPHRGDYTVRFQYTANIAASRHEENGHSRFEWTLPGWRGGLDGVEVVIVGPPSLDFAESEDALATIERTRTETGGRARLHWNRAHLPRTIAWTLGFIVEGEFATLPESGEESPQDVATTTAMVGLESAEPGESAPLSEAGAPQTPVDFDLLALWLCLLSAASVLLFRDRAARHRTRPRPLLPLGHRLRLALLLGGAGWAMASIMGWLPSAGPWGLLLGAIGFERTPRAPHAPHLGAWRVLGSEEKLPVIHRPWDRLMDGGTVVGLVVFIVTLAVTLQVGVSFSPWIAVLFIPWLSGTGAQLPMSLSDKRTLLLGWGRGLRSHAGGYALGLAVHEDGRGAPQDIRLRVATPFRATGLVRFDVAIGERPGPGGLFGTPTLIVVTREQSDADRIAAKHLGEDEAHRTPGGRHVWIVPLGQIETLATALGSEQGAAQPPRRKQTRRPRIPDSSRTGQRA